MIHNDMSCQQNILLDIADTETYVYRIKLSQVRTCKLRSMHTEQENGKEDLCKRALNLYSNHEEISVGYDFETYFANFLPQFIKNGAKDLYIYGDISDIELL